MHHNFIGNNLQMRTKIFLFLLLSFFGFNKLSSQTSNQNINNQLQLMRKYLLEKNYDQFANFVYPAVYKMTGGKTKMIQLTKQLTDKMESDGFKFIDIIFTDASDFVKSGNETQFTITEGIVMQTPKGKILATYTLIGISGDNGKNWKFMDTSGKTKEIMTQYFPNLSKELIIKPKTQKLIE